jgi:hypothetical protein
VAVGADCAIYVRQLVVVPIDVARCSVPVSAITGPPVALRATLIVGVAAPPVEALSAG